jgi:uncharacterized protein with GYD domain
VLAFLFFEFGKEADVATYLDLISFTDQGIRKVTHSPEGAKAATCGGELGIKVQRRRA